MPGEIVHGDLGPQLVETEFGGERWREVRRAIEQIPAAMTGRRFGHQEIGDDVLPVDAAYEGGAVQRIVMKHSAPVFGSKVTDAARSCP